jgi:hypothetical protein
MMKKTILATLLATFSLSFPALASENIPSPQAICEANGIQQAEAQKFITNLQAAVTANNAEAIASLAHFPITVNQTGKKSGTFSETTFKAEYNTIFSPAVKDAILKSKATDIDCNAQGAMIGAGVVWFNAFPTGYQLFVINQ